MPITKEKPMRTISQCGQCGESFNGMVELKDHIRKVHIPERMIKFNKPVVDEEKSKVEEKKVEEVKPTIVEEASPPVPIILEYHFSGVCPECRHEVRTIMLDVDDFSFATAYCVNCSKKLLQQKVIPISQQGKKL